MNFQSGLSVTCAALLALITGLAQAAPPPDPLDEWTFVHPRGPLSPWGAVAYGNGHYVVVAADAAHPQILWSSNAVDWIASPAAFPYYYSDVLFVQGKFWLAGGEDHAPAVILTSSDGIEWEVMHSDGAHDFFSDLHYANGTWVARALSDDGPDEIVTSTNGINWSVSVNAPDIHYLDVTGGLWVGVEFPRHVYRSTNGLTWSAATPLTTVSNQTVVGIAAGAGTFLAFGNQLVTQQGGYYNIPFITRSTDGVNWFNTAVPELPALHSWGVIDIVHGANGFVAIVLDYGGYDRFVLHSDDGATWDAHPFPVSTSANDLSFANELYFLTGGQGVIFTSPNGIGWTQRAGASTRQLRSLAEGPSGLVAVGKSGLLLTSPHGTNWTRREGITRADLADVSAHAGRYVAVGGTTNALVLISSNTTQWDTISSDTHGPLQGIASVPGDLSLGVGLRGSIARITQSGVEFLESLGREDFRAVARMGNTFLAVATSSAGYPQQNNPGTIYSSIDGLNWTPRFAHSNALYAIAASNVRAVAVGAYGAAFVSADGLDWQRTVIATNAGHWLSIAYGDGAFLVPGSYGNDGKVFSSVNGIDWIEHQFLSAPLSGYWPNVWNEAVIYGIFSWVAHSSDRFYVGVGPEYLWRSGRVTHRLHSAIHAPPYLRAHSSGVENAVGWLQTSIDLVNWTNIGPTTNHSDQPVLLPMNMGESHRFYRIVSE
jgi:hypothetical protein